VAIRCWASAYSPCGGGQSREHLVSKGFFETKMMTVQGFDWCLNEPVPVSVNSMAAKILCRKHNSLLGIVDDGGIEANRAFQQAESGMVNPSSPKAVNGPLFERWLLKMAINLSYGHGLKLGVGIVGAVPGLPSKYFLDVVFGDIPLTHNMGAYFLFPHGQFLYPKGQFLTTPIHKNGEIGGVYFHITGFDLFLSLRPGDPPPTLGEMGIGSLEPHVLSAAVVYHSPSLITLGGYHEPQQIQFNW
jgi:hypothetical protein